MLTACLCSVLLILKTEESVAEHPIQPRIENGLSFMFSGGDDSVMKATTARIYFLPKINNKL